MMVTMTMMDVGADYDEDEDDDDNDEFVDNDYDFSDDNADDIYELMNLLQQRGHFPYVITVLPECIKSHFKPF